MTAARQHPFEFFSRFLKQESAAGLLLMGVAGIALLIANSRLAETYFEIWSLKVAGLRSSLSHCLNDSAEL